MRGIYKQYYNEFVPEVMWLIWFQFGNGISEEIIFFSAMQTSCIAFELDITDMSCTFVELSGLQSTHAEFRKPGRSDGVGHLCCRASTMWQQCESKL